MEAIEQTNYEKTNYIDKEDSIEETKSWIASASKNNEIISTPENWPISLNKVAPL